ncbi:PAS domain-containing protein [Actinoplanes sp. NPDC051851]|uniref:PAS domain-containing protein n=1 Tax=Actinoplanes sp. NPDC051851 TaxID=3154753 RepID=UPI003443C2F7
MSSAVARNECGAVVLTDPLRVLEAADQGYFAVDASGRVLAWNAVTESVFGHRAREACGRDAVDLIIPERFRKGHRAELAALMSGATANAAASVVRRRAPGRARVPGGDDRDDHR